MEVPHTIGVLLKPPLPPGFPLSSVGKESTCNAGDLKFDSWVRKLQWRRERLPTPVFLGFPGRSAGKEFACRVGDLGLIPGLGRSPGEGKGYPLQYPGLENWTVVHGVTKSWTPLSDFHSETSMAKVRPGPGSPRRHSPRAPGSAPALWGPCPATLLLCSVFLL